MKWKERELEDYLFDNIDDLSACIDTPVRLMGPDMFERIPISNLSRQVQCEVGIIDLMFTCHLNLYIVELKAVTATEKTIGKVKRYSEFVRDRLTWSDLNHVAFIEENVAVVPVIVAPSFDSKKTNVAGVLRVETIKNDDGDFVFSCHRTEDVYDSNQQLDCALKSFRREIENHAVNERNHRIERVAEYA